MRRTDKAIAEELLSERNKLLIENDNRLKIARSRFKRGHMGKRSFDNVISECKIIKTNLEIETKESLTLTYKYY